jgi:aspartyl-tRNA(Asn)/glutamyl-tRNA(Gln) amidotransferase subunit A
VRTVTDAAAAIRSGDLTARQLVEESLTAAEASVQLNALAHLDGEGATAAAAERDAEAATGAFRGPLHGIPVTVKDLFVVDGMPTRCGAGPTFPAPDGPEGTAVTRLRDAGAIILGKANLHEVAYGITGENPWTDDVRNPHDPARQAGGSSSGSGAAVAAGIGLASLGTDTGGSIRVPASHCGIVGFKPTTGRVPLDGALPLSTTCDHAGPLVRSVADAALVTAVLAGDEPAPIRAQAPPRVGVPLEHLAGALSRPVRHAFEGWLDLLRREGVEVVDIDLPGSEETMTVFRAIQLPEAARTHAETLRDHPDSFSPITREYLERGAAVTADQEDEGRRRRAEMAEAFDQAVGRVDALVLPASPVAPPLRGSETVDVESGPSPLRPTLLHLTAPFSLTGLPALVVPFATLDGLPVGLQVVGPRGADEQVLAIGAWLEGAV